MGLRFVQLRNQSIIEIFNSNIYNLNPGATIQLHH